MLANKRSIFDVFKCYKLSENVFLPPLMDNGYILVKNILYEVDKASVRFLKSLPLTRKHINNYLSGIYNRKLMDLLIADLLELKVMAPERWLKIVHLRIKDLILKQVKQITARIKSLFGVYLLTAKCFLIKRKLRNLNRTKNIAKYNNSKTVLLIAFGGIGDMVLMTPMLQVLKKIMPDASIDVIVKAKYAGFFKSCPLIDHIIKYPGSCHVFKWLGKPSTFLISLYQKYDITIGCCEHFGGTCRWFTGKALLYLIDADMRISTIDRVSSKYPRITKYFLTDGIEERYEHEATRMLRLLKPLGASHREHQAAVWEGTKNKSTPNKFNLPMEFDSATCMVGISPFTRIGKQWPIDRYAKLIRYLLSNFTVRVILLGTKKNRQEAAILRCLIGENNNVMDLTGMTSTEELITVIKALSLLISPDSGPAHIAAACRIPEIVLFGRTNPHRYSPWMNRKLLVLRTWSKKVEDISVSVVCKASCKFLVEINKHFLDSQLNQELVHRK